MTMFLVMCRLLGTTAGFKDREAKMALLNYSLCHCPVEEIEVIIAARRTMDAMVSGTMVISIMLSMQWLPVQWL